MHTLGSKVTLFFLLFSLLSALAHEPHSKGYPSGEREVFVNFQNQKLDEKSCQKLAFGEIIHGQPKYWAQTILRPKDPSLFLTKEELKHPIVFGNAEKEIDSHHPALSCLHDEDSLCRLSTIQSHGSRTVGLVCSAPTASQRSCGIVPHQNTKLFQQTRLHTDWRDYLRRVLAYNKTVPKTQRIRIINFSFGRGILTSEDEKLFQQIEKEDELLITHASGNRFKRLVNKGYSFFVKANALSEFSDSLNYGSDYGNTNALSAPVGNRVQSIGVLDMGGTSAAAPFVQGLFVLLQRANPSLSASAYRKIAFGTATLPPGTNPIPDSKLGYGLPNIPLALALARSKHAKLIENFPSPEAEKRVRKFATSYAQYYLTKIKGKKQAVTHAKLQQSQNCEQYAKGIDLLHYQYMMSNRSEYLKEELCKVYIAQEIEWGQKYYCSLDTLKKRFGDDLYKDRSLFARIAKDTIAQGDEKLAKKRLETALSQDTYTAIRDFIGNSDFRAKFPKLWEQAVEKALKDAPSSIMGPTIVSALSNVVLSRSRNFTHPRFEKWLALAKDVNYRDLFSRLSESSLPTSNYKLWSSLVDEALKRGFEGEVAYLLGTEQFAKRFEPKLSKTYWQDVWRWTKALEKERISHLLPLLEQKFIAEKAPVWWKTKTAKLFQSYVDYLEAQKKEKERFKEEVKKSGKAFIGRAFLAEPNPFPALLRKDWFPELAPKLFETWVFDKIELHTPNDLNNIMRLPGSIAHKRWEETIQKLPNFNDKNNSPLVIPTANARFRKLDEKAWLAWMDKQFPKIPPEPKFGGLQIKPYDPYYHNLYGEPSPTNVDILGDSEIAKQYPKRWREWVKQAFYHRSNASANRLLANPLIQKEFPKLWEEWLTQDVKESGNSIPTVLATTKHQKRRDWIELVQKHKERNLSEIVRYLLPQPAMMEKYPDVWSELVLKAARNRHASRNLMELVLSQEHVFQKHPELWETATRTAFQTQFAKSSKEDKSYERSIFTENILENPQVQKRYPKLWQHGVNWLLGKQPVLALRVLKTETIHPNVSDSQLELWMKRIEAKYPTTTTSLLASESFVYHHPELWERSVRELMKRDPRGAWIALQSRNANFHPNFSRLRGEIEQAYAEQRKRFRSVLPLLLEKGKKEK